ncbi:MAG: tetratricopeptide repeat protein, partial [Gemmataceae bacterium]
RVRLAQKKSNEALRHLDSYLKSQPQAVDAYELKIEVLEQLGRKNEVLPMLKSYAERDVHNLALQLLVAGRFAKEKEFAEAEKRFLGVVSESPSPEAYLGLFSLFQAENKMDKAVEMLDGSLAKARGNDKTPADASSALRARTMLGVLRDHPELVKAVLLVAQKEIGRRERTRETWQFLAALAGHAKQLDAAERLYLHCMKLLQALDQRERNEFEHQVYSGLLEVQFKLKKYDDVIVWSRKGLKECEAVHRLLLHDYLFRALAQQGKFDGALGELDEAIKAAGPEHQLYFRRTRTTVLSMAGKHDEAAKECRELLERATKPEDLRDVRYTLSGIYTAAKKFKEAEEQLRAILETDPSDDVANNDLGYIMADQNKNLDEAEKLIRKALELDRAQRSEKADKNKVKVDVDGDQDRASYIDSLGWVLFRKGQVDEARKELERAVKLPSGDDPVLWDHLGDVYLRLGQKDQARTAFLKANELYENERRRRRDDQYRELQRKLKLLK